MSWNDTLVTMLRALINDLDATSYTDTRLEQLLVVSAQYVIQEMEFDRTYTINICSPNISPDPTGLTGRDNDAFMNFVVLKAACIADQSLFRTKSLAAGIRARCGPALLETLDHLKGFRDLIDFGPCKAYETLKTEFQFGNYSVHAVLSPFISNNFDPHSLRGHGHRGRFS